MSQWNVLRYGYDTVFAILKTEGARSNLFSITEAFVDGDEKTQETKVFLSVSDIAQIAQDKNGEKVIVTEEGIPEQQFPAPTYMAFILVIHIMAEKYQDVLETAGYIARYFKDNNTFNTGAYNWHGNANNMMYLEPLIREPNFSAEWNGKRSPCLVLAYRLEAAINSEKGETFKRVQERDIRGKPIQ